MRKLVVSLTVAVLGSATLSIWLWNELRAERLRNAGLSERAASLPAPVATREEAVSASVRPTSDVVNTPENPAATQSSRMKPDRIEDEVASERRKLRQEKYREAWRAQQRLNYSPRRENVIRLVGLSAEEADAVVEVAIDRQLVWIDRPQTRPMTPDQVQQERALAEQEMREDDAKLRALLGEEKFERFEKYMESRSTRVYFDRDLRPQFAGAAALRDDQVEPLIAALHVERSRLQKEQQEYRASVSAAESRTLDSDRELELLKATYERMHTAAAPILSDAQLERLDVLLKRDLERQALQAQMLNGGSDGDTPRSD